MSTTKIFVNTLVRFSLSLSAMMITHAALAGPATFSYEGRAYDGSGNPLTGAATFTLRIYSPSGTCLLYEENTASSDLTSTAGYFSVSVGSGTVTSTIPGSTLPNTFSNRASSIPGSGSGCPYAPAGTDGRLLEIVINPIGSSSITLSPKISIGTSPFAMAADDSNTLQGLTPASFAKVDTASLTQGNLNNIFSSTNYPLLVSLLNGTNSNYVASSSSGAQIPSVLSAPSAPSTGQIWFSSTANAFQYFNGTSVQTLGNSGAGISSLSVGSSLTAGGNAGGTLTSSGTIDIADSGVLSGTYPKVSVNSRGLVTYGTGLAEADVPTLTTSGHVSGSSITSGVIGGTTSISSSGSLTTTGSIQGATLSSGLNTTRKIQIFDPANGSVNKITITAPTLSQDYSLTFPSSSGTANSVLTNDGSGNLSWSSGTSNLSSLASGKLWIGNASNTPTPVSVTGDIAISSAGIGTVSKLSGAAISSTAPSTAGQVLRWDGNYWIPNFIAVTDLRSSVTGTNAFATSCSANQTLTYNSVGDAMNCASIAISNSQIAWASTAANLIFSGPSSGANSAPTFRSLSPNDLPAGGYDQTYFKQSGNSFSAAANIGTNDGQSLNFKTYGINRQTITATGNIGIGTSAPQALLDVFGTGAQSAMIVPRDSNANRPTGINGMLRYSTSLNQLETYSSGAWSVLALSSALAGYLPLTGGTMTGITFHPSGSASAPSVNFGDPSSGLFALTAGSLSMATASAARLTINSTGNIGIGTINPLQALHVVGFQPTGTQIALENASSGGHQYLLSSAGAAGMGPTGSFNIGDSTAGTTRLTLAASGYVGIGTINPSAKLDVSGHVANSGTAATVTSCGTSPSINGNDTRGIVTLGSGGPTACTITFSSAFASTPICTITPYNSDAGAIRWFITASTSILTMNFTASPTAGQQWTYQCMQ